MFIGEIIKEYRNTYKLSQRDFAARTNLTYGYINILEKIYNPKTNKPYSVTTDVAKQLADAMRMPIEELIYKLDETQEFEINNTPINRTRTILVPIYGNIPENISFGELKDDIIEYERLSVDLDDGKEYFGIEIHGDTMYDYKNMDRIIFKKISDFKDGQDCIVTINNEKAIFTKILKQDNGLLLQAIDPENKTVFYTNKDIKQNHITVLGIAVKLIRNIS